MPAQAMKQHIAWQRFGHVETVSLHINEEKTIPVEVVEIAHSGRKEEVVVDVKRVHSRNLVSTVLIRVLIVVS